MNLKRVLLFTAMFALIATSVYGYSPIVTVNAGTLNLGPTAAPTGSLNMENTSAIIQGTPDYAGVQSYLKAGYNVGTWTGVGMNSSIAANPTYHGMYALAPMSVTDYQTLYGPNAAFYGPTLYPGSLGVDDVSTLAAGSTLVKFTYMGDGNLDGRANTSDATLILSTIAAQNVPGYIPGTITDTWYHGNYNYDAVMNTSDATLILGQILYQNANPPNYPLLPLSAGGMTPVPEPSTIILLLFGFVSLVTFKKLWK